MTGTYWKELTDFQWMRERVMYSCSAVADELKTMYRGYGPNASTVAFWRRKLHVYGRSVPKLEPRAVNKPSMEDCMEHYKRREECYIRKARKLQNTGVVDPKCK